MSSASIMGEIQGCHSFIETLHTEIAQLEEKIEKGEYAYGVFVGRKDQYQEELAERMAQKDAVAAHGNKVVFSHVFRNKTDELMGRSKQQDAYQRLDEIARQMKEELARHLEELDRLQGELHANNLRLEQLYRDYHNACAAEAAAAAAAAEAAAGNK